MEKQKVFWVVLAVSVFVVVVLIVGVLLLRQHPVGASRATVTPMNGSGTQVYEYQREAPLTQPSTGPQAGTPPAGDQQTLHFYIGEGAPSAPGAPGTAPGTSPGTAPAAPGTPAAPVSPSAPGTSSGTAAQAPAAVPIVPAQAAKPKTTRPAAAAAAPRKAQYWIQAGAYKSQTKAEELATMLEGKGLSSRVFSYLSKNETWYRVRVGPYTNRGEAGKFLSLVKQVQGLETSYISLVSGSRSAVN
jgi:cell division protein FtsN